MPRAFLTAAISVALSAGASCDNNSLHGVYPFTANSYTPGIYEASGTLQCLSPPQLLSSVGQYSFDDTRGLQRRAGQQRLHTGIRRRARVATAVATKASTSWST